MFWLLQSSTRILHFFSEEFRSTMLILWNKEWFFSRHVNWTLRFDMMTISEIISELLREPKNPYWFLRHLLFLQVETLPSRHEILRWDSLSLRWIRVSEWVLGIRSLFQIFLLNHLPQKKIHLFGLSRLLSHSVFRDIFQMRLTFSNSISAIRISSSQNLPANRACPRRIR